MIRDRFLEKARAHLSPGNVEQTLEREIEIARKEMASAVAARGGA